MGRCKIKMSTKVLVTGGAGFLGGGIARKLAAMEHDVRSFSRGEYPELKKYGIENFRGDLADFEAVKEACAGCEAVFHVAAKAGVWGDYDEYYRANYLGTENVVRACRENGIGKLVYTSTPSVVFSGHGHEGCDESAPYPEKFLNFYSQTKSMAEALVLGANSPELATVSLRPHMIWGPGDNHLIPRIVTRARAGRIRIVGNGSNLVDSVYIDNAVDAHILAFEKLAPDSNIAGKSYFITNDEPVPMGILLNRVIQTAGLPPVSKRVPEKAAYAIGGMMEFFYKLLNKKQEPMMTRFLAKELAVPHWFDISAAKRDLGYEPRISIDEGMERLRAWLQQGH
jgi:2-alkyl-3-oxoalkanoate reductase